MTRVFQELCKEHKKHPYMQLDAESNSISIEAGIWCKGKDASWAPYIPYLNVCLRHLPPVPDFNCLLMHNPGKQLAWLGRLDRCHLCGILCSKFLAPSSVSAKSCCPPMERGPPDASTCPVSQISNNQKSIYQQWRLIDVLTTEWKACQKSLIFYNHFVLFISLKILDPSLWWVF